jgi:predicted nucleotidyltransferase
MHPFIEQHRATIRALAARYGIESVRVFSVRVFGSMAHDEAGADSDLDLLVSLPPGNSGLVLGGLLMDIQDLTQRKVDVVTGASLHPAIRERVLREAQPL